jgi:hypothetical protein
MLCSGEIELQATDNERNNMVASEVVKMEYEECETIGARVS